MHSSSKNFRSSSPFTHVDWRRGPWATLTGNLKLEGGLSFRLLGERRGKARLLSVLNCLGSLPDRFGAARETPISIALLDFISYSLLAVV